MKTKRRTEITIEIQRILLISRSRGAQMGCHMKSITIAWKALTMTVTIVGLTNWNTLSLNPVSQTAKAASTTCVTKLADPFASSGRANGRILFTSDLGIYTMNADGSDRMLLTSGSGPAWSPDGTQIAFVRTEGLPVELGIYIMPLVGSNQRQISQDKGVGSLTWSPDGTQIAFVRTEGLRFENGIYIMNPDGSNQRRIAQEKDIRFLSWSPDGTKLAFSSWDSGNVYLVNSDGSDQRIIKHDGYSTSWSPDGSKLVIAGDDYALYL